MKKIILIAIVSLFLIPVIFANPGNFDEDICEAYYTCPDGSSVQYCFLSPGDYDEKYDLNGDGLINVGDIVFLRDEITKYDFTEDNILDDDDIEVIRQHRGEEIYEYDLNGDGLINVGDIVFLRDKISRYDLNSDSKVDNEDIEEIRQHRKDTCTCHIDPASLCSPLICTAFDEMNKCLNDDSCYWDQETDKCYNYDSTKQKCSDPDGGVDIYVQGHTFGFRTYSSSEDPERDLRIRTGGRDGCVDNGRRLVEHYCVDDYFIKTKYVDCQGGCDDGACKTDTACSMCEGGIPTGQYDSNGCMIYKCPTGDVSVCGNGICEEGENGDNCFVDCKYPTEGVYAKLNHKFKLKVNQKAKITDYKDMMITFLDVSEAGCIEKTVSHKIMPDKLEIKPVKAEKIVASKKLVATPIREYEMVEVLPTIVHERIPPVPSTSVGGGGYAMPIREGPSCTAYIDEDGCTIVKCTDGRTSSSCPEQGSISVYAEAPTVITRCKEGQVIAKFEVNLLGEIEYISLRLGEKKEVFGVTFSFLDYISKHRTGIFLVSGEGVIECPEECICYSDGTMECPDEECAYGYILCPDGVCRKECFDVELEECKFGCLFEEYSCLPIGTRMEGLYCNLHRDLVEQKTAGEFCDNSFECDTNLCIDGQCIESGVWKKFLAFFKKWF